ncbi:Pentatricopeptide repeat-containing protein [Rhynchospora pubera]|uniref:Pentatricopeptide repeat-containing protein n=1 Tax=Rhynchospora pubera TaxID=906938 RepID=A0AAV8AM24_9POAL|nr:Pentatricopeptide repeat-containing protein [Rhynchospora pubera]
MQLEQAWEIFNSVSLLTSLVGGVVLKAMIDALCKYAKIDEAYNLYNYSVKPRVYSRCCHHKHSWKYYEAETIIYGSFRDCVELDTVAYNTCIKSMLEAGKLHSAVSIYDRMISSDITPSLQTYGTMISVYGRGGKLEKAIEVFKTAQNLGVPLDEKLYTNMLNFYGKAGRFKEASHLFDKMKKNGIKPGLICYNSMINACATSGFHEEAESLLDEMCREGHSPDSVTYVALVRAYIESSHYSKAEETLFHVMPKKGVTPLPSHFNHLIIAYNKEGSINDALRIYDKMREMGVRPSIACCRSMMRAFLEFGLVEEGISFFETLHGCAKPDRYILSGAAHLYEFVGNGHEAAKVLDSINVQGLVFIRNLEVGSKCDRSNITC